MLFYILVCENREGFSEAMGIFGSSDDAIQAMLEWGDDTAQVFTMDHFGMFNHVYWDEVNLFAYFPTIYDGEVPWWAR